MLTCSKADLDYEVGGPVYYKNQRMQNKLDARWKLETISWDHNQERTKPIIDPKPT